MAFAATTATAVVAQILPAPPAADLGLIDCGELLVEFLRDISSPLKAFIDRVFLLG